VICKTLNANSLRLYVLQPKFLLTIILIGGIVSIGAGLVIPNTIAESPEMKPSSIKDSSAKYYYDSETDMYKVKAGGGGGRIVVIGRG